MRPEEKINVLMVIKPIQWSGADKVLMDVATRLNKDKYKVIFAIIGLHPEQEFAIPDSFTQIRFDTPNLHGWRQLLFSCKLCWLMWKYKIKIIHMNSYHPGNYCRLAAYLMRVPIIIDHWHGFGRFNFKRRMICRLFNSFTDLSFAVSAGVGEYVHQQCGTDPAKIRVLYNAVDLVPCQKSQESLKVREELGLTPDQPVVGLVARLDHRAKGHLELIQALALLKDRHPLHALMVGGGRRQEEMRELAASLGLQDKVHFLGNRRDVPVLLQAMDIFVLPSHNEGVSLAVLEAMAAGLPVIVSAVGGLPEIVQHEENGLLIPPKDVEALARSLAQLRENPDLARKLGKKAREHIEAHYSLERMGQVANAAYDELVKEKIK
ncbi:MAG: glycosyltransferase family 4 protein [Syntrophales bacterium]|nr:glycosyltransferase family 4 protein [Syntrophales bacterium]MDD5642965.1 glycosyltransferase family 4 protein [Syntrophales bacterium]